MSNRKITDMVALTTPASDDVLPIVDISEAAAVDKNKKISIEELFKGAPSGTAAAPSIAFESDSDSGIFLAGTNTVGITTAGTQRVTVDSSGNVGIARSAPDNQLSIGSTASFETDANSFYLGSNFTGTGQNFIGSSKHAQRLFFNNASSNGYLSYANTGSAGTAGNAITWQERFRITSDGKLGVGTSSPGQLLHLNSSASTAIQISDGTNNQFISSIKTAGNFANGSTAGDLLIRGQSGFAVSPNNGSSVALRVDSSGNITATGSATFASTVLANGTAASPSLRFTSQTNMGLFKAASGGLGFATAGSQKMEIDSSGRVGIGNTVMSSFTANSSDNLVVGSGSGGEGITVYSATNNQGSITFADGTSGNAAYRGAVEYSHTGDHLAFRTAGTGNRMLIDSSGNVGIGNADPGALLHVADSSDDGVVRIGGNNAGGTGLDINYSNSGNSGYTVTTIKQNYRATNGNALLDIDTGIFTVSTGTAGNERLRISPAGNVGIGTSSPSSILHLDAGTGDTRLNIEGGTNGDGTLALAGAGSGISKISFWDQLAIGKTSGGVGDISSEFFRIVSSGNVGIGTSSPSHGLLTLSQSASSAFNALVIQQGNTGSAATDGLHIGIDSAVDAYIMHKESRALAFGTANTERLRISSDGKVGIGTTSADGTLHVHSNSAGSVTANSGADDLVIENNGDTGISILTADGNNATAIFFGCPTQTVGAAIRYNNSTHEMSLGPDDPSGGYLRINSGDGVEAARIDSSGNVGVGLTSPASKLHVKGGSLTVEHSSPSTGTGQLNINSENNSQVTFSYDDQGHISFGTATTPATQAGFSEKMRIDSSGRVKCQAGYLYVQNSASGTGDTDGLLLISDGNADKYVWNYENTSLRFGTNSQERMRITSGGDLLIGQTNGSFGTQGTIFGAGGQAYHIVPNNTVLFLNRQGSDGEIVRIAQGDVTEGNISVSGSTVSYNGGHLSRWSQLAAGAARTEILRGSVLSNLDEMCEWGEEDNEQLNRMKVSNVEGDRNVSGVFQAWDDDDDTYVNDFYCAMTGDFVIRIAQGTTVARGDLLMSAGDGTAKPQDDDIVRSKTIAKVTSTTVSTTYSDNSYCVPCVLMAC